MTGKEEEEERDVGKGMESEVLEVGVENSIAMCFSIVGSVSERVKKWKRLKGETSYIYTSRTMGAFLNSASGSQGSSLMEYPFHQKRYLQLVKGPWCFRIFLTSILLCSR